MDQTATPSPITTTSIINKIITNIIYLCPTTSAATTTTAPVESNVGKRLISTSTTEPPLTAEELSKQRLFATIVIVCFCLSVLGIVMFVSYNFLRSKWDAIVKEEQEALEEEDDEEMGSLPEENEGLLESINKEMKIPN